MYIREAHPSQGRTIWGKRVRTRRFRGNGAVSQPRNAVERHAVAKLCVETLGFTMPTLVDDLDDSVSRAYGAFPDRLFAIDPHGVVFYAGGPGPHGFSPNDLRAALAERFGAEEAQQETGHR